MSALAYLKTYFTLSVSGLLLVSGLNFIIDPYGIFYAVEIKGINDEKLQSDDNSAYMRRIKSAELLREDYQVVLLGTSRINRGVNPDHPAFRDQAAYNLGLDAAGMAEIHEAFKYADENLDLDAVVLSLDFFSFSEDRVPTGDFKKSRFSDYSIFLTNLPELASLPYLQSSLDTLLLNLKSDQNSQTLEHGFAGSKTESIDHREVFRLSLVEDFIGRRGAYTQFSYSREYLDRFREIVEYCQNNNIKLYLYISPIHVQLLEAKWAVGLYPTFEQWKRDLVAILAETADKTGKPAPVLLDFSGYNSITTEAIPELGEKTPMRWYRDASHFTEPVGDMVIEALTSYPQRPRSLPADFGVAIDTANIESHLAATREAREHYHRRHPYEVAEVRRLYQQTELAQNHPTEWSERKRSEKG